MKIKKTLLFMGIAFVSMNVVAEDSNDNVWQDLSQAGQAVKELGNEWIATPFTENVYKPAKEKFAKAWNNVTTLVEAKDVVAENITADNSKNDESGKEPVTGFHHKVVDSWNSLSTNQKYILGAATITAFIAGIAYKLGCFSKSYTHSVTAQDIKKIVESALLDVSNSEENKLHYVLQALVNNGLGNIVVYNENEFEVEDGFKVQFNENNVCVTRK